MEANEDYQLVRGDSWLASSPRRIPQCRVPLNSSSSFNLKTVQKLLWVDYNNIIITNKIDRSNLGHHGSP